MKKVLFAVLAICAILTVQAQKVKGDLSPLKGQKEINIVFDYKGVTYDGDSESAYLKGEKFAKDPEWKAAWTSTFRTEKWEPRLIEDINKELVKKGIQVGDYPEAEYTIVVKLSDIDPGSFAGPMSQPAKISGMVSFRQTASSSSPFATIELKKISYSMYFMAPQPELRVGEAFSNIGELIGKAINKVK